MRANTIINNFFNFFHNFFLTVEWRVGSISSTAQLIADFLYMTLDYVWMLHDNTIVIPKKLDPSRLIKNMLQVMQLLCH